MDLLFARERGEDYDQAQFDATMTKAVDENVRRKVEAGVDIVSDGEASKLSYSTHVKDRYTGFSGDSPRNAPADLKLFPTFMERLSKGAGTPTYTRPQCTGEITSLGHDELNTDIANLKAAMEKHGVKRGFMNAASPGVVAPFLPNQHYLSRETYLEALADALKAEYEAILAAGLGVQLDCPDRALSRQMLFSKFSDDEFIKIAEVNAEVMNHALRDVPREKVRVHACWGNYEGPRVLDLPMDKVFSTLMWIDAKYLSFENVNPRHGHEWKVFRTRKDEIPDDKVLLPGVIDPTTNFVEHPELVAERIARFTDIVGEERVISFRDCGFGTFAGCGAVDPQIAYAKLGAMAEGAAMKVSEDA
ncbi:MAG: epoxyalkane--coenzyme M transferase [Pseudomonadota bacterium]